MVSEKFGERLSRLVMLSGKSMTKVSAEIGIREPTLWHLMQGIREPRVSTLIKIAKYFKVHTDYLLGLSESPSAEPQERKGKWIHREDMDFLDENKVEHIHFMCSECGLIHDFLDWHTAQYNYCPNCGARMEVDNEQVSI